MWDTFRSLKEYSLLRDSAYDELENLRLALEWGLERHVEAALRLAANFNIISSWIGNQLEGLALLKLARERFDALPPVDGEAGAYRQRLLVRAMFSQGMTSMSTGGVQLAIQSLQEAIALARQIGDKRLLGYSLEMLYTTSAFNDALSDADAVEEGYRIFSQVDDNWGRAMALMNMARVARARGNLGESQMYFGMLKDMVKDAPISFQTGMFCLSMGYTERFDGHPEIAKGYFEQGLIIFKQLRHKGFETVMLSELGHIARVTGDLAQAKQVYKQTIPRYQDIGNRGAVAHQLECFAFIAIGEGQPQRAARLFGAAEALRQGVERHMNEREKVEYDQEMGNLRSLLTETDLNTLWSEGRSMTMGNAIDYALS
jgi:tetratricopeptide (TPR) repeat protein